MYPRSLPARHIPTMSRGIVIRRRRISSVINKDHLSQKMDCAHPPIQVMLERALQRGDSTESGRGQGEEEGEGTNSVRCSAWFKLERDMACRWGMDAMRARRDEPCSTMMMRCRHERDEPWPTLNHDSWVTCVGKTGSIRIKDHDEAVAPSPQGWFGAAASLGPLNDGRRDQRRRSEQR